MLHVLFVDDEPQVLSALRASLRPYRTTITPHFASSAAEALELLAQTTTFQDTGSLKHTGAAIDIIVSDVRMPQVDGASLLDTVAHTYPTVLRLALTGQVDAETSLRLAWSAHQVLTKPTPAATLAELFSTLMGDRDMLADAPVLRALARPLSLPMTPEAFTKFASALEKRSRPQLESLLATPALAMAVLRLSRTGLFGTKETSPSATDSSRHLDWVVLETIRAETQVLSAPWLSDLERLAQLQHDLMKEFVTREPPLAPLAPDLVTASTLCDVALLALVPSLPRYKSFEAAPLETLENLQDIEEAHGSTHAELGAILMSFWGLPRPTVELVAAHHFPPEPQTPLAPLAFIHALALATCMADQGLEHTLPLNALAAITEAPLDYWEHRARELLKSL